MNLIKALLLLTIVCGMMEQAAAEEWLTRAEKSGFTETSPYDETIEYCRRLESASPWIRYSTFGKSPEGRDLPVLIASKNKRFTPQDAAGSKEAILLIINGIHSGEIAGKEATLMLLRDIAINKSKAALLDHVIVVVVPIFNIDGHERSSPYNRINQNGPREMGWRATAQNLNLNRDWMKADQPEMRAMLKLFHSWLPDFVIDNHVSDGADYQYDLTYIIQEYDVMAEPVKNHWENHLEPGMLAHLKETKHITGRYFELVNDNDLSKGIAIGPAEPRFSDSYITLQNRPAITVETHMLKSFKTRIIAHYDLMEGILKGMNQDPKGLRMAVQEADRQTIELGSSRDQSAKYAIRYKLDESKSEAFTFKGIEYHHEQSPISGATRVIYGGKPVEMNIPVFRTVIPSAEVKPPIAYIIPQQWTEIIDRLGAQKIEFSRLPSSITHRFETYRFEDVKWKAAPFEGRNFPTYKTVPVTEERTLKAGSVVVRLNQRTNKIILGLLEPEAPDSLIAWGFFNAIFEAKEYAEPYVLEKLAEDMIKKDPELRVEFERKLKSEPEFEASPEKRLQFFYERSPYHDPFKNAYPIVRVTSEDQLKQ